MRILLVFPPMLGQERYGKLARAGSYLPPLGLAYLASVLGDEHQIKIIDGGALPITINDIGKEVESWRPDLVGVSTLTPTFYRAVATCKVVKEINPKIITVLGGPHPTACPEESIKNDYVDIVVVGEGEKTFKELVEVIKSNGDISTVRGIHHKKRGHFSMTLPQERILNLDTLPFPARHLLNMKIYRPAVLHFKKAPVFSIMCGRGCPYKCTFCSCAKVFRGKVTMRSPENVISEIKFLIETYGAKEIMIWDDTFGLYKRWVNIFCESIKPLKITWSAWMRVDLVDKELLERMAESGCWHISYGVESGNQKVLDTIKKGFTIQQIKDAFRRTHEAGMEARGTFILGLPNDTWETMMDTINIAIEIDADYAQFQLLTPYPGTELWDKVNEYGEFLIKDLSKYTIWFPVFVPKGLTKEELLKAHQLSYRKFYLRPKYLWKRFLKMDNLLDMKRNFTGLLSLLEYFYK